jgi:biotin-(acetyl-CoA carboxylase) ligase
MLSLRRTSMRAAPMTLLERSSPTLRLTLPPAFAQIGAGNDGDAFAAALRMAGAAGPGALAVSGRADVVDLAVVLAPEEALASARRALFCGMLALAEAVGATGPSETPVTILWPDTLLYDGARLGGGRLGWPQACAEQARPDWLVFGATLIASKAQAGDPGLTPGSTSLEEEGFAPDAPRLIVESFARNLMKAFEIWSEDGFDEVAARFLAYAPEPAGRPRRIDETGDLLAGEGERRPLGPALLAVQWRDPRSGGVRL